MREIEFRVFDLQTDKIYKVVDIDFACGVITATEKDTVMDLIQLPYDSSEFSILIQYTGLKDKNGKKIFEGDLLRVPAKDKYEEKTYNCFEVFYHDNECIGGQNIGFCINRMHTQGHSAGGYGYKFTPESIKKHGLVICGNIHQDKHLIK